MAKPVFRFIEYDTRKYDFVSHLQDFLGVTDLSHFHEHFLENTGKEEITVEDNFHFRDQLRALDPKHPLLELFKEFMWYFMSNQFGGKVSYGPPFFRMQMGNSTSVSKWHRDTEITGRHDQITCWMPFTDAVGDNTIWVETDYGNEDFQPIDVKFGQVLLFDSSYLKHGSVTNTLPLTRVSMDFRVTPKGPNATDLGILSARPPRYERLFDYMNEGPNSMTQMNN